MEMTPFKHGKMLYMLILYMWLWQRTGAGEADEYALKNKLLQRYIRSVRPVKNFTDTVHVKFDLAMRALVGLDEKNQVLTTNTWIRVYWKDAYLVWDPNSYSDIHSINFPPTDIWVPDIVLYNSADETGRGLLDYSMKTNVIVKHTGDVAWLCPMVLKSECTVNIKYFPFDQQSCPLQFGLWTFDGIKVNLSMLRPQGGDLSSYLPSGEWLLDSMPGHRNESYFSVAPTIPYPYILYHINITRRTKFYLMNIIWPGILIALLAALSYVLPPECGERVGLGITNLLAMMVFLLMISESIPPTSEAIPLASKFFTSVLVLSALTLVSSAVVITYTFYSNPDPAGIPWFIRVVVCKWLAKLVCVPQQHDKDETRTKEESNLGSNQNCAYQIEMNGHVLPSPERYTKLPEQSYIHQNARQDEKTTERRPLRDQFDKRIADGLEKIVQKMKDDEDEAEYKAQWRRAAKIIDRFFLLCFMICIIGALLSVYIDAPKFYVP